MALTLEEANRIIRGALAKAQELNIKISAAVCDSRRPADRIAAHGQRDLGERLWQPGQGRRLGGFRAAERRDDRTGRPADPARDCRGDGRPHDHGPGSGPDHPQRRRRRRLRCRRRHLTAGRGLRPGRGWETIRPRGETSASIDVALPRLSSPRNACPRESGGGDPAWVPAFAGMTTGVNVKASDDLSMSSCTCLLTANLDCCRAVRPETGSPPAVRHPHRASCR